MKVLFVKSVINTSYFTFDIGIGYLDAILNLQHHQTNLFLVKSLDHLSLLDLRISLYKPDIIAFSTYASAFNSTLHISRHIKKKFPDIHQIIGGIHLILNPNDWIRATVINAVCTGEGEVALPDYLSRLQKHNGSHLYTPGFWVRSNGKIYKNPPAGPITNLDDLPFPSRRLFIDQDSPTASTENKQGLEFLFTRGCPYNCTYCSNNALKQTFHQQGDVSSYVRHMSPNRAIKWIMHDLSQYPAEYLCFHDDTFTVNKEWLLEFLRLYKQKISLPFMCNIRIDTVDKPILRLLKQAGCFIVFAGVESGDEELRRNRLKRYMSNESIITVFREAKQVGLHVYAFLMIGLPGETPQKFINTIRLVSTIKPDYSALGIFYPYPGTELYEYCKQKKYINPTIPVDFVERIDTILTMKDFCRKDILHYYQYFNEIIALANKINIRQLPLLSTIKYKSLLVPPSHPIYPWAHKLSHILK
jgi:radical SAM superfamily enzyme YgiQ (UPF0313 family)